MKRGLPILVIALSLLILSLISSFSVVKGEPSSVCGTPTPGGTIPLRGIREINFSASQTITQTTVYTLINLGEESATAGHQYFFVPGCWLFDYVRTDTLILLTPQRYSLEDIPHFPDTFSGEVHIRAAAIVAVTSEVIPRILPLTATPTETPTPISLYLPFAVRSEPIFTPEPTATSTFVRTPTPTVPHTDNEPPHFVSWSFLPTSISASSSDPTITFVAHFTDNSTGLGNAEHRSYGVFYSPSRKQEVRVNFSSVNMISGTDRDGIYKSEMRLPRQPEKGQWRLAYLYIQDNWGNEGYVNSGDVHPNLFTVTN